VNFSSFRVSNRHQQQPQHQHQQLQHQQQNAVQDVAGGGTSAAVARAVAAGGNRLLSASAFGNTLQQHRQLQQQKRDAAQQLQRYDNGTPAVGRADHRGKNHRKSAAAAGTSNPAATVTSTGTSLRYCKSVSPIAEKPPARQSPPRSASMNLQPRNFVAADSCLQR